MTNAYASAQLMKEEAQILISWQMERGNRDRYKI
jgi:hypothetical protein